MLKEEMINKINPHPTEAITLLYDMNSINCSQVYDMVQYLQKIFPNNKVVAIPNTASLESCSKDVLENIVSMIAEIIEQL